MHLLKLEGRGRLIYIFYIKTYMFSNIFQVPHLGENISDPIQWQLFRFKGHSDSLVQKIMLAFPQNEENREYKRTEQHMDTNNGENETLELSADSPKCGILTLSDCYMTQPTLSNLSKHKRRRLHGIPTAESKINMNEREKLEHFFQDNSTTHDIYLIFRTSTIWFCYSHQVWIKKLDRDIIKEFLGRDVAFVENEQLDKVDYCFEMKGFISDMNVSPDHR